MNIEPEIIDWLMTGDPSIRFQVMRDVLKKPGSEWMAEQRKMEISGWGRQLLDLQDKNGYWGGGLYSPKWISTHYTLMLLLRLELPRDSARAIKGCRLLLDNGYYEDGGINLFRSMKHSETCVTGMILSLCSYFQIQDSRINDLFDFLIGQQMSDGGWNCQSFNGATHSSMHTTISVLEGLYHYKIRNPDANDQLVEVENCAHEFLLQHRLYKSDKTGNIINPSMTRMPFPPRWRYDVVRVLEYFCKDAHIYDGRMADGIDLIVKREKKGKWPLQANYPGRVHFNLEEVGKASKINTLRAIRILDWWEKIKKDASLR